MGNDTLYGGNGDDTIFGGLGDDLIVGGPGADLMDGGDGVDRLSYVDATTRVVVDLLNGTVRGSDAAGDVFFNFEDLEGGAGGDLLLGDQLNNYILGADGDDELQGRFGNDTLEGGAGADTLDGSGNTDTAAYFSSPSGVTVSLFSGMATGGHANGDIFLKIDNLIGSVFQDVLTGSFNPNEIEGGAGADTMNGGAGRDTLSYARDTTGVTVSIDAGTASGGDAAGDSFVNFENLRGGLASDSLTGDGSGNYVWGGEGADTLTGLGGSDTLQGGVGADVLQGGDGVDWASYSEAGASVDINLLTSSLSGADAEGDVLLSIEALQGTPFDDVLSGDAGDNWIEGGPGADTLSGGDGADTLSYQNSNTRVVVDLLNGNVSLGHATGDVISGFENLSGSRLPDYLLGSNDANTLSGGRGRDLLEARGGNDTLIGGTEDDVLTGGAGADVFVLGVGDGGDRITDWQDGFDRIDLSDFGLSFSNVQSLASDETGGHLLVELGGGDRFLIDNFGLSDFDSSDVIV